MKFEDWFEEMEGYSFRSERFYDDFDFAAKTNDYGAIIIETTSGIKTIHNGTLSLKKCP